MLFISDVQKLINITVTFDLKIKAQIFSTAKMGC